jgi:eukaryotic-like serine/threonine-protein kinase
VEELVFGRRYRALEKIGTGGMADVYKAVDEVLGRTVAVKVMHARYASDPSFAVRFRQEAQAAANLVSPNIVNMYDWGADDDTYYMVMEYVRGSDLKSVIQQKGSLASTKVADIGAQVCSALSVAHGYDIIHRDIKPHNIMVQPDGSVKVMDFGIARAGNTTMTQTGSVLGTAHYVSPEQAQGKELHATSDLYSLGIVLYEASTGHLPFDADTPVAVALKQVNEQPRAPRSVNPNVDPGLEAIIVKAMQKNPAQRYSSADEMRRDLQAVAAGNAPSVAAAAAASGPAAPSPADHTAVLPIVGGATSSAAAQNRRLSPAPKKRPVWPWVAVVAALLVAGLGLAFAANQNFFQPKMVAIPDMANASPADATAKLQELKLVVGAQKTEAFSDTVPEGKVASTNPPKDTSVPEGSTVVLVLSKGPQLFPVPKVVGLAAADAASVLSKAGFSPMPGPAQFDAKVPEGTVISQDPTAGASIAKGVQVTYITSKGQQINLVPDVRGKSKSSAIAALNKAGFKDVSSSTDFSSTVDAGDVISQSPSGGGSYPPKTKISIVVSDGPGITIPSFGSTTTTLQEAIDQLKSLGLKPSPSSTTSATVDAIVNSTDPSAGTVVKKSTKVTIHYTASF